MEDEIVYTAAGPTRTMAPRPVHTTQELELPDVPAEWSSYYKNIAGVLDGREDLIVKPEQALRVMKGIDLIFQSNEKGVVWPVGSKGFHGSEGRMADLDGHVWTSQQINR